MSDKKTILIVDDEPDVLRWLTVLFENNGYRAVAAKDGVEGIELAETEHPDLITLDISMPRESGVKMYKKLLESGKTADIPVIMLTGAPPELDGFLGRMKQKKKPAAFLEKPVTDEELLAEVRQLIG
ncbi:MAG: response regulator [candidate division Zixibacteria bacterium]|nr:response regulator [candidate division Zixibacteria bacterium]MBU1471868.1 response regulator [candidate division Zixibacteria bacterium]